MANYCSAVPRDSDHVANDEELENLGKIQSPDIRSFQRLRECRNKICGIESPELRF